MSKNKEKLIKEDNEKIRELEEEYYEYEEALKKADDKKKDFYMSAMRDIQNEINAIEREFEKDWKTCPNIVVSILDSIETNLILAKKLTGSSPFNNTGATFENDTFKVRAYQWDFNPLQDWNFKYKNIEIRWYKHLNRSPEINGGYTHKEMVRMYLDCINSIWKGVKL